MPLDPLADTCAERWGSVGRSENSLALYRLTVVLARCKLIHTRAQAAVGGGELANLRVGEDAGRAWYVFLQDLSTRLPARRATLLISTVLVARDPRRSAPRSSPASGAR